MTQLYEPVCLSDWGMQHGGSAVLAGQIGEKKTYKTDLVAEVKRKAAIKQNKQDYHSIPGEIV